MLTNVVCHVYRAYRALYILNWIYRYFTEKHFGRWICKLLQRIKIVNWYFYINVILDIYQHSFAFVVEACISGLVQTALYGDFFYYYFIRWSTPELMWTPKLCIKFGVKCRITSFYCHAAGKTTQSFNCQHEEMATSGTSENVRADNVMRLLTTAISQADSLFFHSCFQEYFQSKVYPSHEGIPLHFCYTCIIWEVIV